MRPEILSGCLGANWEPCCAQGQEPDTNRRAAGRPGRASDGSNVLWPSRLELQRNRPSLCSMGWWIQRGLTLLNSARR